MADAETADVAAIQGLFDNVDFDSARLQRYEVDGQVPRAAIRASTIGDVERAQSVATSRDLAVVPMGGRTMLGLGMPPSRYDIALDLFGMNQVVDYEPDDFTITAQAGMTLASLQQELAANGQFLPLDHPRFEQATLGGICAVGRGGLRRNALGGPRDWLIGMRMVKADGTTIKGGGKVVKNVSGYDLPKLFAGSLGTLGVIAEVTFKLRPQPVSDQVVALPADSFEQALAASRAAARAAPFLDGCLALSEQAAARAAGHGAEILEDRPALVLRASGLESAANEVLAAALDAAGLEGLQEPPRRTTAIVESWQAITDCELDTRADHVRLRLGLPPGSLERARLLISELLPRVSSWIAAGDSGLLFLETPSADADSVRALRDGLGPLQGRLSIESAPVELKRNADVWGPVGPGGRLMHRVKEQFDPDGTLSPGRYVDGI
ncbi:MAG: FAD-binding oxidoreductase [Chloroflexi bacterium]|nr:FAD-binding oxidoreductase [Chloroflexota bacterium]MCY3695862.1 FAD-binding oxidoreductase [Chloroflexota bacterium]